MVQWLVPTSRRHPTHLAASTGTAAAPQLRSRADGRTMAKSSLDKQVVRF